MHKKPSLVNIFQKMAESSQRNAEMYDYLPPAELQWDAPPPSGIRPSDDPNGT